VTFFILIALGAVAQVNLPKDYLTPAFMPAAARRCERLCLSVRLP
jgi:hypothetical protein